MPEQTNVNVELSLLIAQSTQAKRKQCWRNAIKGKVYLEEWLHEPVYYVEGHVYSDNFKVVMEHGWLEIVSTQIIVDPTFVLLSWFGETSTHYFKGVFYSDIKTCIGKPLPVVHGKAHCGWEIPAYMNAYREAYAHCYGKSLEF